MQKMIINYTKKKPKIIMSREEKIKGMTEKRRVIFPPAYMNLMDMRVPYNEIFVYFQNTRMTLHI